MGVLEGWATLNKRRRRAASREMLLLLACLALASSSCRVHELSINDTEFPGRWESTWPRGPVATLKLALTITDVQDGEVTGTCRAESTGVPARECTITGTLVGDTAVSLTLNGMNGSFTGVRRGLYELIGDVAFDYTTGRQTEPGSVFTREAPRAP